MWPEGSFSGGDIMAAKPTFQKLGAFNAPFGDDADANAVQPVYGDIGWAGLKYSKNADMVTEWIDFFGQKENFQSFMQVLQYYPTQAVRADRPVPTAEAPLLKKTAVSMVPPGAAGHDLRHHLVRAAAVRPVHARDLRASTSRRTSTTREPQWQKYIGMFDADWAKLYFSR